MKDSREYSHKIKEFYRWLRREYDKPEKIVYDEPVDALVYAVTSERLTEMESQFAMKRLSERFADWNDLRVSRPDEIVNALSGDKIAAKETASLLNRVLASTFAKYNMLSLNILKKMGKRPARQILEKMDGTSPFAIDYCMLTALRGHAMPLTRKMIEYLKNNELVYPKANEEEISGFLTRQIPADNAYEFYALLRRCSEAGKARKNRSKGKIKKERKSTLKNG
jgi:endonuclease III